MLPLKGNRIFNCLINIKPYMIILIFSNTCECKTTLPHISLMRSFSDCNTVCTENPGENCGGSITSSIYNTFYSGTILVLYYLYFLCNLIYRLLTIDSRGEVTIKDMGCYNNLKRHPILNGWRITISRLTPRECVKSCFSRRFLYAALVSS